jgi:hypothetical protein
VSASVRVVRVYIEAHKKKREDHPGSQKETPAALLRIIIPSFLKSFVFVFFFFFSSSFLCRDDNESGQQQYNVLIPSILPATSTGIHPFIYI